MAEFQELIKEAKRGNPAAQNETGNCYLFGTGVARDEKKASKWFKKAASSGYPAALVNYGERLLTGVGAKKSPEKAIYCFIQAAASGNEDGVVMLAQCLQQESLSESIGNAFAKYRDTGSKYAFICYKIGRCFEDGVGVDADLSAAMIWYGSAADEGYDEAQFRMGVILLKGTDTVPENKEAGIMRLKQAAAQKHADAGRVLLALGISFDV